MPDKTARRKNSISYLRVSENSVHSPWVYWSGSVVRKHHEKGRGPRHGRCFQVLRPHLLTFPPPLQMMMPVGEQVFNTTHEPMKTFPIQTITVTKVNVGKVLYTDDSSKEVEKKR